MSIDQRTELIREYSVMACSTSAKLMDKVWESSLLVTECCLVGADEDTNTATK